MSILVLGTVALDTVKTPFGLRKNILGGSAAHFAIVCRFFTKVQLVAIVGADFPRKYIDFLRRKGIILTSLIQSPGKTFQWSGSYEGDLNTAHTLNTELGVLPDFRPTIPPEQRSIKHVFLANVDPDIQRHLLEQLSSPKLVGLDSMNYWIQHQRSALIRLLRRVNIFVANDQEARSLSGEHNLLKAAKHLRALGPQMILIKKGEHGALFYSDKFIFSLPAYPTDKVIDPTGAGDTFAGAFMGYLVAAKKIDSVKIKQAIAYGTVAASFNIEDFGLDKTSRLTRQDLERRLTKFRKLVLF